MFGGRPEHPLTLLALALTTTTTITSTRLHCRPTVPVPRSSRGPSCNRQPRCGRLFCRSRRQRRHDLTTSRRPGSGSSRRPNDSHSGCCPRRRPRYRPTFPGSRLVRRADAAPCVIPQQHTGTAVPSNQRWQHSQGEALLRHPRSSRPGAISLSTTVELTLKLHFRSTFHYAATHCQTHVRSLARSTVNCSHSRNFFASH